MQNAEIDPVTKLIPPEALYKTDQKKYSLSNFENSRKTHMSICHEDSLQ